MPGAEGGRWGCSSPEPSRASPPWLGVQPVGWVLGAVVPGAAHLVPHCAGPGMPGCSGGISSDSRGPAGWRVPAVAPGRRLRAGRGSSREQPQPWPAGEEGQEAGINPRKGRLAPAGLGCSGWSRGREGRRREGKAQGLSQALAPPPAVQPAPAHICSPGSAPSCGHRGLEVLHSPGVEVCVSPGLIRGWHGVRRPGWSPAPSQGRSSPGLGVPFTGWTSSLTDGVHAAFPPSCSLARALHVGVRDWVLLGLGCWLAPVPVITRAQTAASGPLPAQHGRALCGPGRAGGGWGL